MNWAANAAAIATALIFLYTAFFGSFTGVIQRSLIVMSAFLVLLLRRAAKAGNTGSRLLELALAVMGSVSCLYIIVNWNDVVQRLGFPVKVEFWLGGILILLMLFLCYRCYGPALSIIASSALAYAFLGPFLPGILHHRGVSLERLCTLSYLSTDGIWGVAMDAAATLIIQFLIFSSLLTHFKAGDFFLEAANSIFGSRRGGPAKIAVVASSLFGMISGAATANAASVGTFTIPLMKRAGYRPEVAGAIEAVASSGGQIMPPIMGATAFIVAEIVGISYGQVAIAALVPALLYYLTVFLMVDLESVKTGIKGLTRDELPKFSAVIRMNWPLAVPLAVLIFMVFMQYSPGRSIFFSVLILVAIIFAKNPTSRNIYPLLNGFADAAKQMAPITIACGVAGILIGVLNATGLGSALSSMLVSLCGGSLIVLLLLSAVTCLILGMGLPTVACYVLVALTTAPALIQMGVLPIAAHLFVFYFSIISAITPPVALAAYVAAGIAKANPLQVGFIAMKFGVTSFIVPFIFVYGPSLLLVGAWGDIALAIVMAIIGTTSLAMGIQGYFFNGKRFFLLSRVLLCIASIQLIIPGLKTDLAGLALLGTAFLINHYSWKSQKEKAIAGKITDGRGVL